MTNLDETITPGQTGHIEDHEILATKANMVHYGVGTPEGAVTAPVGHLYLRLDDAGDTAFYFKDSGTGDTGWKAAIGSADGSLPGYMPLDGSEPMGGDLDMGGYSILNAASFYVHDVHGRSGAPMRLIDDAGKIRFSVQSNSDTNLYDRAGTLILSLSSAGGNMHGHKLTNLAAGTADSDAVTLAQLEDAVHDPGSGYLPLDGSGRMTGAVVVDFNGDYQLTFERPDTASTIWQLGMESSKAFVMHHNGAPMFAFAYNGKQVRVDDVGLKIGSTPRHGSHVRNISHSHEGPPTDMQPTDIHIRY